MFDFKKYVIKIMFKYNTTLFATAFIYITTRSMTQSQCPVSCFFFFTLLVYFSKF
jgi:hypothetical protein